MSWRLRIDLRDDDASEDQQRRSFLAAVLSGLALATLWLVGVALLVVWLAHHLTR
jgi:hypothetical protein